MLVYNEEEDKEEIYTFEHIICFGSFFKDVKNIIDSEPKIEFSYLMQEDMQF